MHDYDAIVIVARRAGLADPADPGWTAFLAKYLPDARACAAFIEWARMHPTWQFNVAEVADQVCAKPTEATIMVLANIVAELEDESEGLH